MLLYNRQGVPIRPLGRLMEKKCSKLPRGMAKRQEYCHVLWDTVQVMADNARYSGSGAMIGVSVCYNVECRTLPYHGLIMICDN